MLIGGWRILLASVGPPCLGLTVPEAAAEPNPAIGFGLFAASAGSDLTARVTATAASSNPDNHCTDPSYCSV